MDSAGSRRKKSKIRAGSTESMSKENEILMDSAGSRSKKNKNKTRCFKCWKNIKMGCFCCWRKIIKCCCCCVKIEEKISQIPDEVEKIEITETGSKANVIPCGNENIDETLIESMSIIRDQHSQNELIELSEIKPSNRNLENSENVFEEIKINVKECSDSHENKPDENHSAQIDSNNTKLKIKKYRQTYFESLYEAEDKKDQKSKFSKNDNSNVTMKEMDNDLIEELVNRNLFNAIHFVAIEKLLNELFIEIFEELSTELLMEIFPRIWQSVIWKPLGFANPRGYCYLNSVVQVLGSCEEFKKDIYNYNWNTTEKTNDSIFVEGLFKLIRAIRECNKEYLYESLNVVQQNITESSFGDDIYKCFMNLLTRVSNVIKTSRDGLSDHFSSLPITLSEKAKSTFTRFKNRNSGFVFENFYGQLTFQTVCTDCNAVCNESFQMIKSLPLPVPKSDSSETLNSCIDMFFNESYVEVDEPMKCECASGSSMVLKSITKLTYGPKYLFIYLIRDSYTDDGDKNNTHVTCDDLTIDIKTLEDKSIKYKLISVIDHIGDSAGGHYYCKCSFETEEWWLLNDSQVERLENKINIVTEKAIVFFFKITV